MGAQGVSASLPAAFGPRCGYNSRFDLSKCPRFKVLSGTLRVLFGLSFPKLMIVIVLAFFFFVVPLMTLLAIFWGRRKKESNDE